MRRQFHCLLLLMAVQRIHGFFAVPFVLTRRISFPTSSSQYAARMKNSNGTYSAQFLQDNGLELVTDSDGRLTARPTSDDDKQIGNNDFHKNQLENTTTQIVNSTASATTTTTPNDAVFKQQKQSPQQYTSTTNTHANAIPLSPITTTTITTISEAPAKVVPKTGFNVVLTHATADFDSLASAVGLAKLWSAGVVDDQERTDESKKLSEGDPTTSTTGGVPKQFDSASHVPTFVVLPRGAHPGVLRFLALHKHLFPIRSLKSLPSSSSASSTDFVLNRLALVDAQRRERLGPAEYLLNHAKRITVVDHHVDQDSDIQATDYVVDKVGSVSTLIIERLQQANIKLTEAEATLMALGIHADTGSLVFDSTTPRDAYALAWCLSQGASQAAIAEHAQSSLSAEQQSVLTQALININSTVVHGVTISTVLLSADGFINGLAAVTQDALELSSSDVFLLALVYDASAQRGGSGANGKKKRGTKRGDKSTAPPTTAASSSSSNLNDSNRKTLTAKLLKQSQELQYTIKQEDAWKGGEEALYRNRLRMAFDRKDRDGSGYLDKDEVAAALAAAGMIASQRAVVDLVNMIDTDGNGKIDFEEFVVFAKNATAANDAANENQEAVDGEQIEDTKKFTMILIGRVKAGVNLKSVKLNRLLEAYGGGGHAKAASATVRVSGSKHAEEVLQTTVDTLIETSLQEQPVVGDFMTAPVLSVQPHMTEKQVEDLFTRYDVRALPVVDANNDVIGLVTYKEVAAAKQRLWNKEQKRLRELARKGNETSAKGATGEDSVESLSPGQQQQTRKPQQQQQQQQGTTVKGWMLQHVRTVEASKTMAEVEMILLENDVGCIPVVADGTNRLVGMVTRTDLLRQHRYYPSLPYHNKGFADSIANRKPIIELRKRLKKFDLD